MRLKHILTFGLVLIFLFNAYDSDAQRRRNKYKKRKVRNKNISKYRGGSVGGKFRPYHFVNFNLNALNYYGDLAPLSTATSTDITWTRPGAGANIGYKFNPYMAIRAGFNYGRVKGDDISSDSTGYANAPRYYRNLSFRNDIKELHMGFEMYLFPNYGGPNVRKPFNLYLFVGGAIYHHSPRGKVPDLDYTTADLNPAPNAGKWVKLRPLGTEGQYIKDVGVKRPYSPIQVSIPIAVGAKMRLEGPFEIGVEFGYRYLFTDYIDDASTNYVSFDKFDNQLAKIMSDRSAEPFGVITGERRDLPLATQTLSDGVTYRAVGGPYAIGGGLENGAKRGNSKNNDAIFMTTIKLTWILGQTRQTAKFR